MREPDVQTYEQQIGLTVGPTGRTVIEEDARRLRDPKTRLYDDWRLDYTACCLRKWHDIHCTVRVRNVDDETAVFGHRWRLSAWEKARAKNKFTFPGICPEHGQVRLAPRGVIAHLPKAVE